MPSMASPLQLLLISSIFFFPAKTHLHESTDEAFTSLRISQQGLDFLKDLLVSKAISLIIPLKLPEIEKTVRIPFLGNGHMILSKINIYKIDVPSSYVKPGDSGITIIASGTRCNLSLDWHYSYVPLLFPVEIEDNGSASVQVEGMEVGLTMGLEDQQGTLKVSLIDGGCHVKDISIKLDGGASWFYQGMIDAFDTQIEAAVENAITKELKDGTLKLDSFLQALPKEIPVDDSASLNVTFVKDPLLSNSSIEFDINGLFISRENADISMYEHKSSQPSVFCTNPSNMLGISLEEAVFNSASALYYDAKFMQWVVDNVSDQALLNTAGWRYVIPQLYKKYPKDDMTMNISLSSPPVIKIKENNIDATVYADLIINVLEANEVVPVICISLEIHGSGSIKISGNNLGGNVKLADFTMFLKWSKVGNLHLLLVKPVIWTLMETVFLPYTNARLGKGFPLPIIRGFNIENAEVTISSSKVTVCGDVAYIELLPLPPPQPQPQPPSFGKLNVIL